MTPKDRGKKFERGKKTDVSVNSDVGGVARFSFCASDIIKRSWRLVTRGVGKSKNGVSLSSVPNSVLELSDRC